MVNETKAELEAKIQALEEQVKDLTEERDNLQIELAELTPTSEPTPDEKVRLRKQAHQSELRR